MSDVMTAPPLTERKCQFETLFDASCIELIRLVPRNPYVRALILKLIGQMPGSELETFDQLKDWIERHCTQRVRPMPNQNRGRSADGGISISVEFSETERAGGLFRLRAGEMMSSGIGADDLIEIMQEVIEAGGRMDEVVDTIAGKIDDDAWNECDPEMDSYGDYNYSEHESSDSSDSRNQLFAQRHPQCGAHVPAGTTSRTVGGIINERKIMKLIKMNKPKVSDTKERARTPELSHRV
jgi:hypothetical protein